MREVAIRTQTARQKDLFEETVPAALAPEEMQSELALLMFVLIDVIEAEVRDEQDRP
ncbi:hypothetical protein BRCH_03438 [Candidatus Burkholderia brachyanthoides]|nr:hypothetical protein BRCH_03438 [Candidatus Burkholderia brachyanthoides]